MNEPRGVPTFLQSILFRHKYMHNVQIEGCCNSLVSEKWLNEFFEGKSYSSHEFWGGGGGDGTEKARSEMQQFCILPFREKYTSLDSQIFPPPTAAASNCYSIAIANVSYAIMTVVLKG